MKRIKLRVTATIELDVDAWAEYHGLGDGVRPATAAVLRDDVRSHVLNTLQSSAFLEEADAEITLA